MPEQGQTRRETLAMRRSHQGKSCKLHFELAPIKMVRASKQYIYDDSGTEYLDCINNVSHVGHCHPHVVSSSQQQMAKLTSCRGFLTEVSSLYAKRLVETLPERLCVCYFLNSGSEANDLAVRLARAYTRHQDIVVIQNSYHGNIGSMLDLSHLKFKNKPGGKKDHVHVVPCPDVYRGLYRDPATAAQLYAEDVRQTINNALDKGREIAAFISESLLSLCGAIDPPPTYLARAYRAVREAGGLCIADEVQTGLGRLGDHYWGFQAHDVVPDIVTCGKPLGNGHPLSVVVTTKEIADCLTEFSSTFGGNPVSCTSGLAVLDVIRNEQLMSSAKFVGRTLIEGLKNIQPRHSMLGDIRGQGLIVGIEIVNNQESRKPCKEAAEMLSYKLKEEKIILANDGPDKNVMLFMPPMCFTVENARRVVNAIDKCLAEIELRVARAKGGDDGEDGLREAMELLIPVDAMNESSDENKDSDSDSDTPGAKRPRYEDMD